MKGKIRSLTSLLLISTIVVVAGCSKSATDNSDATTANETKNYEVAQQAIKTDITTAAKEVTIPEPSTDEPIPATIAEPVTVQETTAESVTVPAAADQTNTTPEANQDAIAAPIISSPQNIKQPQPQPPAVNYTIITSTTDASNSLYAEGYNNQLQADLVVYSKYVTLGTYKWISVPQNLSFEEKYVECYKVILSNAVISGYPDAELQQLITKIVENAKSDFLANGASYGITDYNTYLSKAYGIASEADFFNYATAYAKSYLTQKMIITIIAQKENIKVTQAQFAAMGAKLVTYYGYGSYLEILQTYGMDINLEVGYAVLSGLVVNFVVTGSTGQ